MKVRAWQIVFFHSPSGRECKANYGAKAQALKRKAYIEQHGDRCSEPEQVVIEVGGFNGYGAERA